MRIKHGHTRTDPATGKTVQSPTYQSYRSMLDRCYREKHPHFDRYGGRDRAGYGQAITVAARWRFGEDGKSGFECFLADMGVRPSVDHSLERNHVDNDYAPGLCSWATESDQQNNRSNNRYIEIDGKRQSLARWVDQYNVRQHYFKILYAIQKGDDPKRVLERFAA